MAKETGIFTIGEMDEVVKGLSSDCGFLYRIEFGDSVVYMSDHGARFLGMFPNKNDKDWPNALWLNPELGKVIREGRAFEKNKKWPNHGGDRLWVGPEFSLSENGEPGTTFFCRKPGNYRTWECQYDMDPGIYYSMHDTKIPGFSMVAPIKDRKSKKVDKIGMNRQFEHVVTEPIKGLKSVSIAYRDSIMSSFKDAYPWKIVQVPTGDKGTIIFPTKENPQIAVYMNEGLDLNDYVEFGKDHISARTEQMNNTFYKLALPPEVSKKIGKYNMVMHITETPKNGMYQLVLLEAANLPDSSGGIIEVPSIEEKVVQGLPEQFQGKRGVPFVYNGSTPEGSFTELEMGGKVGEFLGNEYRSNVSGILTCHWGPKDAIIEAAAKIGQIDSPYIFG